MDRYSRVALIVAGCESVSAPVGAADRAPVNVEEYRIGRTTVCR